jgi:hypothetical protein
VQGGPLHDLAAALHRLRRRAGEPSMRKMATKIGYSHTVVADAFKGLRCPTWPVLKAIVTYLDGDPEVFMYCWRAVRDEEEPLPGSSDDSPTRGLPETSSEDGAHEDEIGLLDPSGLATDQVHLTYTHGPHTLIFNSERLAWRFLKMRGSGFDD